MGGGRHACAPRWPDRVKDGPGESDTSGVSPNGGGQRPKWLEKRAVVEVEGGGGMRCPLASSDGCYVGAVVGINDEHITLRPITREEELHYMIHVLVGGYG